MTFEKIESLKRFDTPAITNVVATYPKNKEACLGLYHPWESNWYADQTLKCMYPEVGRVAGYVVTVEYGLPDPDFDRLSMRDLVIALDESPKPVILAVKQNLPEHIKKKNGLMGGNMMTTFKACGVVGVMSDGPSRDVDEIRPMGVQYMLTGLAAGHGYFSIYSINNAVNICGMDVCPGEIVHMDENGACKFPAKYLDEVITKAELLQAQEEASMARIRACKNAKEVLEVLGGPYK